MKEYLIVKCKPLGDQWECDADRTPFCMVTDYSKYGLGYEVWERKLDGSFELIKDYEEALEEGFALYFWNEDDDVHSSEPTIQYKKVGWTRDSITKAFVKKLKQEVGFQETVDDIFVDIDCRGSHGEIIGKKWVVFGEYMDDDFGYGF
jgi:hypothetical protein